MTLIISKHIKGSKERYLLACKRSESARERRIALYKNDQQQQQRYLLG